MLSCGKTACLSSAVYTVWRLQLPTETSSKKLRTLLVCKLYSCIIIMAQSFQTKTGNLDSEATDEENLVANFAKSNLRDRVTNQSTSTASSASGSPVVNPAKLGAGVKSESYDDVDLLSAAERSMLQKIIRKGLNYSETKLEIKQKDPTSPLYSATSFQELNLRPELLKGIYAMGFNSPSRIQENVLPILLANPPQNLIAQSQSGTGKTAAFVLAMLSRVDPSKNYPQVLCLSPTYELALQTGEVLKQLAKYCPEITVVFAVRGESAMGEGKLTEHIVIGTPGKVTDWAFREARFALNKIRVFVLDEADVMIATQGFHDVSIKIHRKLPHDCQFMLFSATYEKDVMEFAEKIVPEPTVMRLKKEEVALDNIKQYYIECENSVARYRAITNIYGVLNIGKAIIFCQTRKAASWLSSQLSQHGHAVGVLSGELGVEQRIAILTRFRLCELKVLVCTNVMARGIDIEQVTFVVNFDLPTTLTGEADFETYLHRIGRTGRFGKSGIAINLVQGDRNLQVIQTIRNHFGKPILKLDAESVAELQSIDQN